jgi:hypothetical protein
MDPVVSFIIGVFAAGLKDVGRQAVQDAYTALKNLIIKRFQSRGKPEGEQAVKKFEEEPEIWEAALENALKEIEIQNYSEIMEAARHLAEIATYSLDLDFRRPDPKFPGPPDAQLYIKTYSTDKGRPFITPHCVTFEELDYQIRRLEDELKAIRQKARKKFEDR